MDLELVITTILTWMRVNVQDAQPWALWIGCVYAVYGFFRGNWVILRDIVKAVHWTTGSLFAGQRPDGSLPTLTGVPALFAALNTWRKRPSKLSRIEQRCGEMELELATLKAAAKPETKDEIPAMPPVVTEENRAELQRKIEAATGPVGTDRAKADLESWQAENRQRLARERAAADDLLRQADLQAQVARARRELDGGLARNAAKAKEVYLSNTDPA